MDEIPHTDSNLRSVELSFGIIEQLRGRGKTTLAELTAETDLAKSTIHSHLTTLTNLGYVVKEDNAYRLSLRFLELGEEVRNLQPEYRILVDHVEALAERFEERAQFIVEEEGKGVYIYRKTGSRAVMTDSGVGKHIPLHSTAAGKAILAHMPREEVQEIIERHGLGSVTEHTITDEEELYEELDEIRERGYAFNREENLAGLNAVGVHVKGADGTVLGALSVSGPSFRLKGAQLESEIPDFMLGLANEIELNLAYPQ
ncbi:MULTISPECIES: IclR family transcriptional regulator [Haloferax]|uniref:Helix-turn-helix domain-containing protein n=2 Tax=Haloferax TaxID=2251 RepID=A0A6G1Z6U3_9EURY|nr:MULTISPECIES: IclR family transcriptional regulator [Haloferax]KAB1185471.1 IclR family transcriptional regulator [Haloferax sp. CBA1149]MRW82121.1 helix-turn-helix domain-containing protein [Haloferax marinisediminis]